MLLVTAALVATGYAALPGSDGLTGELRFLLTRAAAADLRRATTLLATAERRNEERAADTVAALLDDDSPAAASLTLLLATWPRRELDPHRGIGRGLLLWANRTAGAPPAKLQELIDELRRDASHTGLTP
ncbi:MAG: hypothetical protein JXO22_17580 [Phycisphaerae bacterium]|nr:hypothetical protein [Phycisphaerae bacterium]